MPGNWLQSIAGAFQANPPTMQDAGNAALGAAVGGIGAPVDLANMVLQPLGLGSEKPVMGSDWLGERLGADTDTKSFLAGSMLSPDPMSKIGLAGSLAGLFIKGAKENKLGKLAASDFEQMTGKKGGNSFTAAQHDARSKMSAQDRAQVDLFDPEDFSGKVYMTPDSAAGFSLSDEGYLGHVFRHPESEARGTFEAVMTKARGEGAKDLDAFDTYLVDQYKKQGAVEKSRSSWNEDYATQEIIDALGEQQPDFVGMNIGGVFPEYKHSKILGPRAQEGLPRRLETPTGKPVKEPKNVAGYFEPDNKKRIFDLVEQGMERDGHKWYHLGGVLDAFIDHQGVDEGLRSFDEFMAYSSAVSPRSNVATEIKRASVLRYMKKRGESIKDISGKTFPKGYGHMATKTAHRPSVNRIEETGVIGTGIDQPKITSYDQNKKLNYQPLTADGHNMEILTGQKR